MIKYFCDRCGKSIKNTYNGYPLTISYNDGIHKVHKLLCEDCLSQLYKFLGNQTVPKVLTTYKSTYWKQEEKI